MLDSGRSEQKQCETMRSSRALLLNCFTDEPLVQTESSQPRAFKTLSVDVRELRIPAYSTSCVVWYASCRKTRHSSAFRFTAKEVHCELTQLKRQRSRVASLDAGLHFHSTFSVIV